MKAELKAKWIEALRSDRFSQLKGALRDENDGRCCLGVLYEIAGLAWIETKWGYETAAGSQANLCGHEDELGLPLHKTWTLAAMNDGDIGDEDKPPVRQHTFAEIADYIEREIPAESAANKGTK